MNTHNDYEDDVDVHQHPDQHGHVHGPSCHHDHDHDHHHHHHHSHEPIHVTKIGRNEPCPCGSGKKYKKCCIS